jgi:hypothetical protein
MARKEDLIIRVLVDSAAEIGIVKGLQAFAAKMAPLILQLEREGTLNELQIALALGWDAPFIYGNRINRKKFAKIILDKLQLALIANANPGSALARGQREKQMRLW